MKKPCKGFKRANISEASRKGSWDRVTADFFKRDVIRSKSVSNILRKTASKSLSKVCNDIPWHLASRCSKLKNACSFKRWMSPFYIFLVQVLKVFVFKSLSYSASFWSLINIQLQLFERAFKCLNNQSSSKLISYSNI